MNVVDLDSVCVLLVGTNGTGKSTKLRAILEAAAKGRKKKILVLPSNPAEPTFKDVPEISLSDIDKFHSPSITHGAVRVQLYNQKDFIAATKNARNTVIISDDFRNYITKSTMHEDIRRALIDRRHRRNDFYLACHGFTQVPPEIFSFCSHFMIFRCKDNPKRHADKLLNANDTLARIVRVNQIAEKTKNPYYFEISENQ